jgi:type VI secretion system protein ImpH
VSQLPPALAHLVAKPGAYDFFAAVRLVERAFPDAVPVGHQGPAAKEALRFAAHLSLSFPAGDLMMVEADRDGEALGLLQARLTQTFLGLFGPASPLGSYLTERMLVEDNQHLARGFLDLIHHRLVSLLVRGHAKYHPADGGAEGERFLARMLQLSGLEPGGDDGLPGRRLMAFAGLVGRGGVAGETLAAIVSAWADGAPATVEPCLARWTPLPPEARTLLGRGGRLGRDALAGRSIHNRTTAFGLTIGPLPRETFTALVPGGRRHGELRALVERLNPERLDAVIELRIAGADLPATHLRPGGNTRLGHGSRLGGRQVAADYAVRVVMLAEGAAA